VKPTLEGQSRQRRPGKLLDVGEPVFEGTLPEGLEFVIADLHDRTPFHRSGVFLCSVEAVGFLLDCPVRGGT
jgi:hypothetical protein